MPNSYRELSAQPNKVKQKKLKINKVSIYCSLIRCMNPQRIMSELSATSERIIVRY